MVGISRVSFREPGLHETSAGGIIWAMSSRWPSILMYHSIDRIAEDDFRICTSPRRFESHLHYLKRHNLRGVSVRELHQAMKTGSAEGLIGLTFDDGYKDFLGNALPILEGFGFSATVFVIGGLLGRDNDWDHYGPHPAMKLLDAGEVREVAERGMEVGAHSMSHPKLSELPPKLVEEEVRESRRVLGEVLGEPVEGFCYPYGDIDKAAVGAVREAGFTYGCSIGKRPERSVYDLPRIPLSERDDALRFTIKLNVYSQYVLYKRLTLHKAY